MKMSWDKWESWRDGLQSESEKLRSLGRNVQSEFTETFVSLDFRNLHLPDLAFLCFKWEDGELNGWGRSSSAPDSERSLSEESLTNMTRSIRQLKEEG